eukprot:scaffold5037_cov38-Cyclotella_meneghiniana.AAC.1
MRLYLTVLKTGVNMPNRKFTRTFITSKRTSVKSALTVQKLEDRMTAEENEPAYNLCHSLRQAMAPGERTIGAVTDSNDENDVTEESREQALEEIRQLNEDDANRVLRPNDVSDDMDEFECHTTDPDEFDGPDENNQATGQRQKS